MFVAGALAGNVAGRGDLARQLLGVLFRRGGEDGLLQFLDVRQALRPFAAADAAVAAHTESAAGIKQAHTDAAAGVVDAQGKVADSAKTSAEVIKLSAVDGAKATVTIAAANQEVIKAMQDLADAMVNASNNMTVVLYMN